MSFSNDRDPLPGQRIVYLDGSFDLFHPGHIEQIQKAKKLGDFLYVGVFDDNSLKDCYLTLHERVLMVLAQRSVDDVIIGAPTVLTETLIDTYKFDVVVMSLETDNRIGITDIN